MSGSEIGPQPPLEVQLSTLCWVAAVAAGGVESIIGAAEAVRTDSASGIAVAAMVAVRAAVYTAVLWIASQLWLGRNWARWTLALGLGVVGMTTLLAGPIDWLANPSKLTIDASFVSFATVRTLHVVAVITALVLMFHPRATRYFRGSHQPQNAVPA